MKNRIYIALLMLIMLELYSGLKLGKNFKSFTDDDEIATITSDDEFEFIDAIDVLNENGGTIYIDTPVISLEFNNMITINGMLPGGIIGIRQSNGEYPRLNFMEGDHMDLFSGINIYGSNKFIE